MKRPSPLSLQVAATCATGVALVGTAIFMVTAVLAAGNYAFSPPAGWTRVRSGEEPKWLEPSGAQSVTLFTTTFAGDLGSFVTRELRQERAAQPTQHVWTNSDYTICGRHTGRYVIWTSSSKGATTIWEQMMALWGYDGYVVTYARPATLRPSDVARGSLLSICGVGSLPEQPGGVPVTPSRTAPPHRDIKPHRDMQPHRDM